VKKLLPVLLAAFPAVAGAHALDEYVQHALVAVERNRIEISMRLVPGVMVLSPVLDVIDRNGDRKLSPSEARAYGALLQGDLRLTLDGKPLELKLGAVEVPQVDDLKTGFGAIRIGFTAATPPMTGTHRLELTNRHQPQYSAYVVNSVQPRDKAIRIVTQQRNANQSIYRLDYQAAR
jgi:hypothetical protein